jgi:hypothetical protein
MFAGHIGAALAIGRAARDINVGAFITAALLLDLLLWLFVLLGWESVTIPADFTSTHQPEFVFPYSHGLVASVAWSALAGAVALVFCSHLRIRWRAAALIGLAVLSHWLLDALVHRPELPLAGPGSHPVGLALWNHMSLALAVEVALVIVGVYLFISATWLVRSKSLALVALSVLAMVFTAVGMTLAPAPPSPTAMAGSSSATLVVVCVFACWAGKLPRRI